MHRCWPTEDMQAQIELPGVLRAGGILDRIVDAKAVRLDEARREVSLVEMIELGKRASSQERRSFAGALMHPDRLNVIAEIKQRSPSKGVIREDFDPVRVAESYAAGGAAALSVLCEEDFFGGSLKHLTAVRQRISLPLLRKDFIFDPYQLHESLVAGADAVLLIVAILEGGLLRDLLALSADLGLDALVEVHTADEMKRAIVAGASIVGINNRDLATFKVDLDTSTQLAPLAPEGTVLVSESGINTGEDVRRLRSSGFVAFLVGEHLMRAEDPGGELRRLIDPV